MDIIINNDYKYTVDLSSIIYQQKIETNTNQYGISFFYKNKNYLGLLLDLWNYLRSNEIDEIKIQLTPENYYTLTNISNCTYCVTPEDDGFLNEMLSFLGEE